MDFRVRRIAFRKAYRLALPLFLLLTGCARAMHDDGRVKPLESSAFFSNDQIALALVAGTVARDSLPSNQGFSSGVSNGAFLAEIPVSQNESFLRRGQQRYEIYCAPCHDATGSGNGVIVQRGFKRPLPFSSGQLREARAGYFFDAISRGSTTMFPMAAQIPVEDRWAIVAYVRVLQRSQHASLNDVPQDDRQNLEAR